MADRDRCKVCRAGDARRKMVAAYWSEGMSAAGISATMKDAGWDVGAQSILSHLKEHEDGANARKPPEITAKRDAAIFLRDEIMDRVEELKAGGKRKVLVKDGDGGMMVEELDYDILDKDLQPALGTMLKAQDTIEKRERNAGKQQVGLLLLMLGQGGVGPLAPLALTEGQVEGIIEGEFNEVPDAGDDD